MLRGNRKYLNKQGPTIWNLTLQQGKYCGFWAAETLEMWTGLSRARPYHLWNLGPVVISALNIKLRTGSLGGWSWLSVCVQLQSRSQSPGIGVLYPAPCAAESQLLLLPLATACARSLASSLALSNLKEKLRTWIKASKLVIYSQSEISSTDEVGLYRKT